jgi:thiol-disulfide isomerase/thioredoxin
MKKTLLIITFSLVAISAGIVAQQKGSFPNPLSETKVPEFIMPDLADQQRNISEWHGKVIVLNFWATWCPPCLKEIPEFVELQNELGDKGLQFIGIAIEEKDPVVEFLKSTKINYPILIGSDAGISLSVKLGNVIQAVPYSVVIDRNGNIAHSHPGEFSKQQILEIVTPLL